ncbi:MAG TPA: NUDIX hydrolase [Candidatus Rubrimentiphilum sp.]|nr:NUDIX hydrolase [Candidatus Rubrimentiphilum sp.]
MSTVPDAPKVIASKEIYAGRIFRVRVDTVELEGKRHEVELVEHPGSIAIAALPSDGGIILIRQYRHPAGRSLWEIPAGTAEPDEDPLADAKRELKEETGYSAASWELLGTLYPTPGFCTECVHLYAARELQAGPQQLEQDENIEVRQVSFQDAWRMQASGEIVDMKTMVALLWLSKRPA